MYLRKIFALLLTSAMAVSLASCGSSSSTASSAETDNSSTDSEVEESVDTTLTIGTLDAPITFDSSGADSNPYNAMVFETLIAFDENGNSYGLLAKEYEWVDSLTLKITIQDDVYFTQGQKLTADDVLYSLRYWGTESVHSESFSAYDLNACYTEGENVVYLIFTTEYGPAITDLGNYYIYSQEWLESVTDEEWWSEPNGTGAYICTENVSGSYTSFERKGADSYWGELPECTEVTYKYYGEASTMFIDLEQGVIDIAFDLSETDAERIISGSTSNENLDYYLQRIMSPSQIKLCEVCEYWEDERVREAFVLAMDYEAIATAAFGDLWVEMTSCVDGCNYAIDVGAYETDVDRAKELMEEAGYADGFEITAIIVESAVDMATAVQACAQQIGITINIESYEPSVAVPMWMSNSTDIYISAGAESNNTGDPYSSINIFNASSTMIACCITDETFMDLFNTALYSNDDEIRAENYAALQEWVKDTNWLITVCDAERCTAYDSTKIKSIAFSNPGRPVVEYITFVNN